MNDIATGLFGLIAIIIALVILALAARRFLDGVRWMFRWTAQGSNFRIIFMVGLWLLFPVIMAIAAIIIGDREEPATDDYDPRSRPPSASRPREGSC